VLDVPVVPRAWLKDIANGHTLSVSAPKAWADWCDRVVFNVRASVLTGRPLAHLTQR
jgi:hypothetical protein